MRPTISAPLRIPLSSAALTALLGLVACTTDSVVEPAATTPTAADTAFDIFANISGTAVNNAADVFAGLAAPVADTIRDVPADTLVAASKPHAYVDLDGDAVLSSTADTSAWDIAFRSTGVRVRGEFAVVSGTAFDSVIWAPTLAAGTIPAWYTYAGPPSHLIAPKPGYVLVVKTSSGNYAKIEFLSYYKGAPASPDGLLDTSKHYTFRYVIQKGGNRALKAGTAPRTFYSLRTNSIVTDTSAGWDLGLSGTSILVNGASQLVGTPFDSLKTLPEGGYTAGTAPSWYNYAGSPTHLISPKADTTLAIRLADGKYAKLQIRNYYKGAPSNPNGLTDTSKYYTFRFVLQTDGTRDVSPNSPYTYFSLATGLVVTDTASGWDLGLRTTGLITRNGGQLVTGTFDALVTAPESGYTAGALSQWYTYSSETSATTRATPPFPPQKACRATTPSAGSSKPTVPATCNKDHHAKRHHHRGSPGRVRPSRRTAAAHRLARRPRH
jgi:hypothetical protein